MILNQLPFLSSGVPAQGAGCDRPRQLQKRKKKEEEDEIKKIKGKERRTKEKVPKNWSRLLKKKVRYATVRIMYLIYMSKLQF